MIKHNIISLGLLLGLSFIIISATNHYILTVDFYHRSGEILSGLPIDESGIYDSMQKYIYLASAVYTLIRLFAVAIILQTSLYLNDQDISFGKIFHIVVTADFVFLIPAAAKAFCFRHWYPEGTLNDWHRTYVLSAISLFDNVPADWIYPLQTLNIFEIAYWFILGYGISKYTKLNYDRSLRVVVVSYLPALLIWVTVMAFFTIVMAPSNA